MAKAKKSELDSVEDFAAQVVESAAVERQRLEAERREALERYRQIVGRLAEAEPGDRSARLLEAAAIIGRPLGHDVAADLRHLDAIRDEARLIEQHGDLNQYQQQLRQEQGAFAEEQQALLQRHHMEQVALRQRHLEHGKNSVRVGGVVDSAARARAAVGHLQAEAGA